MNTKPIFRLTPLALTLVASFSALAQLPTNPVLVNGAATINETATGLRVTNLPGTIINWDSFNIGANRSVEFAQLSAASAVMNRVTGNTRSEILGALTSNGRVFLLNPNGVLFGNGARVDVQGLVASTLDLSNEDFLAGNYNFVCTNDVACDFSAPDALNPTRNSIVLQDGSQITARTAGNGGQVWLIARGVVKTEAGSRIDAPLGQVAMAAGREVIVTSPSLGAITFTLERIAGSTIDLAGEIDVERGAAGFFADSIRFAGAVRVPSATDGAGQIVASAGTRIDVDNGARLNVSGAVNADAGAVRLQATQTARVAPGAEIAADGGAFTAEIDSTPGGQGGTILLEAAEVIVPGGGPNTSAPLHARGSSARGLDRSRFGRVTLKETGDFEYALIDGPSFTNTATQSGGNSITGSDFRGQSEGRERGMLVLQAAPSGNGSVLVITESRDNSQRSSSGAGGSSESESNLFTYGFSVFDAAGGMVSTEMLATRTDVNALPAAYTATGLSQGGWVLQERSNDPETSGAGSILRFINAAGQETRRFTTSGPQFSFQLLLNGGLLLTQAVNGETTRSVFDASGVLAADTAAALTGETIMPLPLLSGSFQLNPDERRLTDVARDGEGQPSLVRIDRATNLADPATEQFPLSGYALATTVTAARNTSSDVINDAAAERRINRNRSSTERFGAVDGLGETALFELTNFNIGSEIVRRFRTDNDSTISNQVRDDRAQVMPSGPNGNLMYVLRVVQEFTEDSVATSAGRDRSFETMSAVTTTTTLNQVSRQLLATPFAAQTVAGSYVALVGAASTPGQSNGSLAPPLPPPTPTPPVTPPSPPPVMPPSPPSVTPPSPPSVTPPPVAPPAPPALTPPSSGGIPLEIRPPETIVPPPGNPTPTPPNTARPRGPTTDAVGGSDADVLKAAAEAEAKLVRDLVCSELSAADCLKFDTGLSDIQQDLVDKVTRKQLSGAYWEVIEDMEVPTIHAFFEAIGDLQTSGDLDEELRGGLDDALFDRRIGPDGKPGDSALDRTLGVYDLLVKQAKTPEEKEQLRRDFAEDLLDAAKQQVANKAPPKAPPPPPPGADVANESIIADEAQIQADVKAQNDAREAEAAAEAAQPNAPTPAP